MSYLEEWNDIKKKFGEENEAAAAALKKYKAKLKKELKKEEPRPFKIDALEYLTENTAVVKKTKTGFTQVLPVFDKVIPMAEKLAEDYVLLDDQKWVPVQQALIKAGRAMAKANAAAKQIFQRVEDDQDYVTARLGPGIVPGEIRTVLVERSEAAKHLMSDLKALQDKINKRLGEVAGKRSLIDRIKVASTAGPRPKE